MPAVYFDMTGDHLIEAGADWTVSLNWCDSSGNVRDLTGATAKFTVKACPTASDALFTLTSPSGGILLGNTAPNITLSMGHAATAALSGGNYVYDLRIALSTGLAYYLIEGPIKVQTMVTPEW